MSNENDQALSRRELLKRLSLMGMGAIACTVSAGGVGVATGLFDRLAGISDVELLTEIAWDYRDGTLAVDLAQTELLQAVGTAARIESERLPNRVLLVHSSDGIFYAYKNECPHGGRRIDLEDDGTLKCTSMSSSTFDYDGGVTGGPAESPLMVYAVEHDNNHVVVRLG